MKKSFTSTLLVLFLFTQASAFAYFVDGAVRMSKRQLNHPELYANTPEGWPEWVGYRKIRRAVRRASTHGSAAMHNVWPDWIGDVE